MSNVLNNKISHKEKKILSDNIEVEKININSISKKVPGENISDTLIASISTDIERYIEWLNSIELSVAKDHLLAGPYLSPEYPVWPRKHDNFHYPLGMKKLLSLGFTGIKDLALKNADKYKNNQKQYLLLISKVYKETIKVIDKFALAARDNDQSNIFHACNALSQKPPGTFLEACQLYWFATIFRIGTSTVGRIDQHLYPYYKSDMEKGVIDKVAAKKVVSELLYRFEERGAGKGDTLQNITLGGLNAKGKDTTNPLTYLILEAFLENKYIEPKINIRISKETSQQLLDYVADLQMRGSGICTVFNDDVIIDGLLGYNRPIEIATEYCADGCTEIILDGMGATWFRYIDCVKAIEHTLFQGEENVPVKKRLQYYSDYQDCVDVEPPVEKGLKTPGFLTMNTFDDFYRAYLSQLEYQVDTMLKDPFDNDDDPMRLFTAATMPGVLEEAIEPYTNSQCYHTYGLFIGSLGTAVNSLAAVKSLIYEKKIIQKEELLSAIRDNFENKSIIHQLCKKAPKFGNDDDYVDTIAVDIATRFASWVSKYKDRTGKPILPGLYNHLFHHTAYRVGATPDGRKFGDPVGEHLSPSPGTTKKGPTAIINSVCKVNTKEQIFGSTLHLNIPKVSIQGIEKPYDILNTLNKAFCYKGGCVLNVSMLDVEQLLEAQNHPEKYRDLVVRVWGFSYYFTRLSKEMQDHVISRAENACMD
jgi:formate C-acetyltransferase